MPRAAHQATTPGRVAAAEMTDPTPVRCTARRGHLSDGMCGQRKAEG